MALFLHELVRTVGAKTDEYLDSVAAHQGTSAKSAGRGNMLFGVFRALEVAGEAPQGVNLWRWGDWADAAAILGRQFEPRAQDPALKAWWLGNVGLRRGGFDRILESTPRTADVAALRAAAPAATVFLHEILEVDRAERDAYLEALDGEGRAAAADAGATIVAAFRAVLRDDEVVVMTGFPSATELARFCAGRPRPGASVRSCRSLVLRARHFLTSPWHA